MSQKLGQEWAFSAGSTVSADKCCFSAGFCHRPASLPTCISQSRVCSNKQISVPCNNTYLFLVLAMCSL